MSEAAVALLKHEINKKLLATRCEYSRTPLEPLQRAAIYFLPFAAHPSCAGGKDLASAVSTQHRAEQRYKHRGVSDKWLLGRSRIPEQDAR